MRIPEFTAEASLYETRNRYLSLGQMGELQSGVIPQLSISDIIDFLLGGGGGGGGGGGSAGGGALGGAIGGAIGGPLGAAIGGAVGAEVGRHIHCYARTGRFCD
jgi:hypothetical protein